MSNQLQENLDKILTDKNTNLLTSNLKQGVTCLGIEGSLEEVNNQNLDITENGTYNAGDGYTGLGTVTVNVDGGSSSTYNGRIYNTYTEMVEDVDNISSGDICLVYNRDNSSTTITNPILILSDTISDTSGGVSGNILTMTKGPCEECYITRDANGDLSLYAGYNGGGNQPDLYKNLTRQTGYGIKAITNILSYLNSIFNTSGTSCTFEKVDSKDEIWNYITIASMEDFVLYYYDELYGEFNILPDTYTITSANILSGYKGYHEGIITGAKDLSTKIKLGRVPALSNSTYKPTGTLYFYDVTNAPSYGDSRYVYAYSNMGEITYSTPMAATWFDTYMSIYISSTWGIQIYGAISGASTFSSAYKLSSYPATLPSWIGSSSEVIRI